ncbi:MAG: hypothetical protein KA354_01230 [Phycisphaerae bacterium]|nr:hypothetical protein [Phycisphaerae bacterium]
MHQPQLDFPRPPGELRPDVYVKGKEYEQNNRPDFARERQVVESHGGRFVSNCSPVHAAACGQRLARITTVPVHGWFGGRR